jgi:hypothetical protein
MPTFPTSPNSGMNLGLPPAEYTLLKAVFTDTVPSGPGPDAKTGPLESPGGGELAAVVKVVIEAAFRPHKAKYPDPMYRSAPFFW